MVWHIHLPRNNTLVLIPYDAAPFRNPELSLRKVYDAVARLLANEAKLLNIRCAANVQEVAACGFGGALLFHSDTTRCYLHQGHNKNWSSIQLDSHRHSMACLWLLVVALTKWQQNVNIFTYCMLMLSSGFSRGHNRPISHIPRCIGQISHNTRKCVHMCTFLLQNGTLWEMRLVYCRICEMAILPLNRSPLGKAAAVLN